MDETQLRYYFGPYIQALVATYNSYFDTHGVDFLVLPAGCSGTPDVADYRSKPAMTAYVQHFIRPLKELHIPKLLVPTGVDADGRPTAVQVWGRAGVYWDMFDDVRSSESSIRFLHAVRPLVEAMHADDDLRRREPALVKNIFEE